MEIFGKIKQIADFYGYEPQSNQLVEECAELIQAVNKYRRAVLGKGQPVSEDKKETAFDNLVEELADVQIMIWQISYFLDVDKDSIEEYIHKKLDRQLESISKNE